MFFQGSKYEYAAGFTKRLKKQNFLNGPHYLYTLYYEFKPLLLLLEGINIY